MKRFFIVLLCFFVFSSVTVAQSKMLIGIVPFRDVETNNGNFYGGPKAREMRTAIQDAVTDVFLETKRFSLVEREKMDQLKSEKQLQKSADFIDGSVIEQSKSLGAQYIVMGNISKAEMGETNTDIPFIGNTRTSICDVAFSIKIVDVTTGEIIASSSFNKHSKGKNAFQEALKDIKPEVLQFVKANFKLVASIASIEEKKSNGDALKLLIAAGSSTGVAEKNTFKVFEISELTVDGKKLTRKKTLGNIVVTKVEDENFSLCTVLDGGADIAKKMEAGAKIKCEINN